MKKCLTIISILVVMSAFCLGGLAYFYRVFLAEKILSTALTVPVTISRVDFPSNRSILLEGVSVKNPKGSILPEAFSAKSIWLEVDLKSLFEPKIKILQIAAKDVQIGLEVYNISYVNNSWCRLFKRLANNRTLWTKPVVIDKFSISNIHCEILDKSVRKDYLTLYKVHYVVLKGIGRDHNLSLDEAIRLLVQGEMICISRSLGYHDVFAGVAGLSKEEQEEIGLQLDKQFLGHHEQLIDIQKRFDSAHKKLEQENRMLKKRFQEMCQLIEKHFSR